MEWPNRIREVREARGLSLEKLAKAVNTTKAQISRLEHGDRRLTVEWMLRLAKPLGVEPSALLPAGKRKPTLGLSSEADLERVLRELLTQVPRGDVNRRARYLASALAAALGLASE